MRSHTNQGVRNHDIGKDNLPTLSNGVVGGH